MRIPHYVRVLRRVNFKGGGGETYDAAYNAGILALSQEQQGWASEMYDWYKHGTGTYEKQMVEEGGREWVPGTAASHEGISGKDAHDMGDSYTPATEGYWKETDPVYEDVYVEDPDAVSYRDMEDAQVQSNMLRMRHEDALVPHMEYSAREEIFAENERRREAMKLLPQQTELESAEIQSALSLLPGQTALTQEQIDSQRSLLPGQTAVSQAEIDSALSLIPRYTDLSHAQISDEMTHINERAPVRSEFYNQAMTGADPEEWANRAAADAAHSFMNSDNVMRRSAARSGVNPDSGRFAGMQTGLAIDRAKAIGGAKTQARTAADKESFTRLNTAMGYGG